MRKLFSTLVLTTLLVVVPAVSFAAEFRGSKNASAELIKSETAKNLYIAGTTVNVSGTNQADLVAAGNTLNLNGPVAGGVFAAGSDINLTGAVDQNARLAGSSVNVNSHIKQDLLVAGATLSISPEASIDGDLIAAVGTLTLNGPVKGNLKISGSNVTINSKVGGDVVVYGGNVVLGDNANIAGNFKYHSEKEATISSSAVIAGTTDFQKTQAKSMGGKGIAAAMGIFGFLGLLMSLAILFVFAYALPKSSYYLVKNSFGSVWTNLGWGFLAFVVAPIVLIIIGLTVIGLKLAAVIFVLYGALLMIAFIAATLGIGSQIVRWIERKDYRVDWLAILVGVVAATIIGIIPIIGGLVIWLVGLIFLGQLLRYVGILIKSQRN